MLVVVFAVVSEQYVKIHQVYAHYKQTAEQNRRHTAEEIQRACADMQPPVVAKCLTEKMEAYDRQQASNKDLQAQQDMAFWALLAAISSGAGVFVTMIGIVFVWKTLEANRAAVQVTREIGEAQVRAYLISEGATFCVTEQSVKHTIIFKNVGQSPAFNVKVRCVAWLYPPNGSFRRFEGLTWGARTISCGSTEEYHSFFNVEGNPEMTVTQGGKTTPVQPEIPAPIATVLRTGERKHHSIEVTIGWTDVFKRRQNITFEYSEGESRTTVAEDGSVRRREGEFNPGKTSHYQDNVIPKST